MHSRPATHANSWYLGSEPKLRAQVDEWLDQGTEKETGRVAVGPHAGLKYCGHVLGATYAALTSSITRLVLLAPSHVEYFQGAKTTRFHVLETPIGDLEVDRAVIKEMVSAHAATYMSVETDLKEHSMEMHFPFIAAKFPNARIVPILIGVAENLDTRVEQFLAPLLADPSTAFVVSTDFCHWGKRFAFTPFADSKSKEIWQQIKSLDEQGMHAASAGSSAFETYIDTTGNTVCGQAPLLLLTKLLDSRPEQLNWIAYDQSEKVNSANDSSVSYAAAVGR